MYWDIVSVSYQGEYKLELRFENGKTGIVDFRKYIQKGGIFKKLEDVEYFKQFMLNDELGVITWHNEVDVAPETLYSEATKEPLPSWVERPSRLQKRA